ncbi:MAG: hypothetical protein JWN86_3610 [Planctomycetota bacterium]|nr:hypothetical protein [Planctomycetota bacterium]
MGLLGNLMSGLSGAYTGFLEAYFDADPARPAGVQAEGQRDYGAWDSRRSRYAIHWSMYKNNTYRDIKRFAKPYKAQYGLYRHTRGVYSPSKRIADFFRTHIYGGSLDHEAGDGKEIQTAIPIEAADEALHACLARLWWDSNWEVKKGVFTLWGPVLGDVGLTVVDDPGSRSMALDVVHPGTISYLERDHRGDTRAYQRREWRSNLSGKPDARTGTAKIGKAETEYVEDVELTASGVRYTTYRDGKPFDWRIGPDGRMLGDGPGSSPTWELACDFVPFYLVQHIDEGVGWGCSEFEGGRAKIDELNDLGSKLHDQIRKMVQGAWLISGMSDPAATPEAPRTPATTKKPAPGREEMTVIYSPKPDAKAQSLVGDLDVAATSAEIRQALDNLEDDYPELRFERLRLGGTVSGEALRVAQQPAATRIQERRPSYDYALMCAQMAAVAIGGHQGYDGYEGFDLSSYSANKPSHRIGRRPVFGTDPMDKIAETLAKFTAIKEGVASGMPLAIVMADLGYSPKDVKEAVKHSEAKAAADRQKAATAKPPDGGNTP